MNNIKILVVCIYNEIDYYMKMKEIQQKYINLNANIKYYFIYYKDIEDDYIIDGNNFIIKGNESYIPGILNKTIKAIDFFINNDYEFDFLIRTNISTIINFEKLVEQINELPKNELIYASTLFLNGIPKEKINKNKLSNKNKKKPKQKSTKIYNTIENEENRFASGTNIILSKKICKLLIENKNKLDFTLIDDVSIGKIINLLNKDNIIKYITIENMIKFVGYNISIKKIIVNNRHIIKTQYEPYIITDNELKLCNQNIFIRNRNFSDRNFDVLNMENIVNHIYFSKN